MASFIDLVRKRRSIRRFLPRPVAREEILACIEAARLAPSASNAQPWRFIVVDEPGLKDALCREAFSGIYSISQFTSQAPVVLVVLARLDFVTHRLAPQIQGMQFYLIDIGISVEHFVLQAEELGLSTCWVGWFNARKVRRLLRVPRKYKIVALLPVGYAASRPPRETVRKSLEEVVSFNELGEGAKSIKEKECRSHPRPED
jgi:nitroreductase